MNSEIMPRVGKQIISKYAIRGNQPIPILSVSQGLSAKVINSFG